MPFDPTPSEDILVEPLSRMTPDGSWQVELAHDRSDHVLIWITKGQGRVLLDGHQRGFGAHSAMFIPAGHLWAVELGRNCLGHALSVPATAPAMLPDSPLHLRVASAGDQARLNQLFEAMDLEQRARPALWRRAMQSYSELAGILLRRQLHEGAAAPGKLPAARRLAQAYCRRVAERYADHASMADHAAALNVTPTHLTRVCKAETGKTAAALLTERQLHAARTMLITTSLPMRDIASQLGFGSAAYFTRFITQHTGLTPSAVRKSARLKTL